MLQVGFEPTISAGERPQTYALDRAATGTGSNCICICINQIKFCLCFEKFYYFYLSLIAVFKKPPHNMRLSPTGLRGNISGV